MIVNLLFMGCLLVLLIFYVDEDFEKYDIYGCLDSFNKVSNFYNMLFESCVVDLCYNYINVMFYYVDYYSVYRDVLKFFIFYGM